MKNNLENIRSEIDAVDCNIARLLEKRMDLVTKVADYKMCSEQVIRDESREGRVVKNVLSIVSNPDYHESIKAIFENIMAHSREYQARRMGSFRKSRNKYALLGERLSHSISPEIHELFFKKTGIASTYELLEANSKELARIVEKLKKEGYRGANVTIPFKTEIMRSLDALSDEVLRVGAVNTVYIDEKCTGYNTDYHGFGKALAYYGFNPVRKSCAVLGSGGSSKAVVSWLEDHGAARLVIVTRDTDAAALKYPGLQCVDIRNFSAHGHDLLVNATPVGMFPETGNSPIAKHQLKDAGFVMDLIYNPAETLLLKYARELDIPCANGLYMLVAQAVCSQEIWQGIPYGPDMINSIYEVIKEL